MFRVKICLPGRLNILTRILNPQQEALIDLPTKNLFLSVLVYHSKYSNNEKYKKSNTL